MMRAFLAWAAFTVCAAPAGAQGRGAADFPNHPVRIVGPAGSRRRRGHHGAFRRPEALRDRSKSSWITARAQTASSASTPSPRPSPTATPSAAHSPRSTINPHVYKSLPYDTFRDFAPISQTVTNTIVLIVHPSLPARSVKELVVGRSRPGQLDYGSFGVGNMTHLAGELLRVETGLAVWHIPYKGETPALTELMGGQVALLFAISSAAAPRHPGRQGALARHRGGEARDGVARYAHDDRGRDIRGWWLPAGTGFLRRPARPRTIRRYTATAPGT